MSFTVYEREDNLFLISFVSKESSAVGNFFSADFELLSVVWATFEVTFEVVIEVDMEVELEVLFVMLLEVLFEAETLFEALFFNGFTVWAAW